MTRPKLSVYNRRNWIKNLRKCGKTFTNRLGSQHFVKGLRPLRIKTYQHAMYIRYVSCRTESRPSEQTRTHYSGHMRSWSADPSCVKSQRSTTTVLAIYGLTRAATTPGHPRHKYYFIIFRTYYYIINRVLARLLHRIGLCFILHGPQNIRL